MKCISPWTPRLLYIYIEKLGFARLYLFSLFLIQNIECEYSLEPPRRRGSIGEAVLACTHNLRFEQK